MRGIHRKTDASTSYLRTFLEPSANLSGNFSWTLRYNLPSHTWGSQAHITPTSAHKPMDNIRLSIIA